MCAQWCIGLHTHHPQCRCRDSQKPRRSRPWRMPCRSPRRPPCRKRWFDLLACPPTQAQWCLTRSKSARGCGCSLHNLWQTSCGPTRSCSRNRRPNELHPRTQSRRPCRTRNIRCCCTWLQNQVRIASTWLQPQPRLRLARCTHPHPHSPGML